MAGNTDSDPKRPTTQPHDEIAVRLQRSSAAFVQQAQADRNFQPPTLQYSKEGRRYYDTAPRPLKRLLGSPLAQTGKWARGPHQERQIGSGWGDGRNFSYTPGVNTNSRHQGLDFFAPLGETILACADGVVTFVGYQSKKGAVGVDRPHTDKDGNVLDAKGQIAATPTELGFGGIALFIDHNGDFEGYRTEYYHLDEILVRNGTRVTEGQPVAKVGKTGVPGIGPHLHFQVSYVAGKASALVNPTSLVPNWWPNHTDSTNSEGARGVQLPPLATAGMQVVAGQAANTIVAFDRATSMQNQSVVDLRQLQATHNERIAQVTNVQQTSLYAAAASFGSKPPVVIAPMTFDFSTGTWNDGKVA